MKNYILEIVRNTWKFLSASDWTKLGKGAAFGYLVPPRSHSSQKSKHQKAFSQIESDSSFICIHHDITDLN